MSTRLSPAQWVLLAAVAIAAPDPLSAQVAPTPAAAAGAVPASPESRTAWTEAGTAGTEAGAAPAAGTAWTEAAYLSQVARYHPMALQAETFLDEARAMLMQARGGFDPAVGATAGGKSFEGTHYYTAGDASLRAELRGPVGVELGYGLAHGDKMNPERYTPDGGVLRAGVRVDLGQGWGMDVRRLALEQAAGWGQLHAATRLQRINDLLYEAARAYWNWHRDWHLHAWAVQAEALAADRLAALQTSVEQGDRPALDLTEARAALLQRQASTRAAEAALLASEALASAHLWDAEGRPVALPSGSAPLPLLNPQQPGSGPTGPTGPTSPSPIADPGIDLLTTLQALPPLDLQPQWFETPASLRFDGRQILLETQADWAREQLKPQLTLRAAALLGNDVGFGAEIPPGWGSGLAQDNHQWGITFSYPLLTRDARAKVRLANIQLQRWSWEQQDAHRRWSEQIRAQHASLPMRQQASSMSREAAEAAGRLLQGEQLLFEAGESSLFLLLQRENNWIEAQRSAIQAWSQWQLARREWIWRWEGGF